jgi:hypothetical protein
MGEGLHRQFMGAVDEFPDDGVDDFGRKVQAFRQHESGKMLIAEMVPLVVALPDQDKEGGHDVGHHPVDVEGQVVFGDRGFGHLHVGKDQTEINAWPWFESA